MINDVDLGHPLERACGVKVIGRDDVSGVDQVRLSNDGEHWSEPKPYTSTGSTPTSYSWDLTDSDYGGSRGWGRQDRLRRSSTIALGQAVRGGDGHDRPRGAGGRRSSYSAAVLDDSPAGYWRLGERGGNLAANSGGRRQPRHLPSARPRSACRASSTPSRDTAAGFDGTDVSTSSVPSSGSLSPQDAGHARGLDQARRAAGRGQPSPPWRASRAPTRFQFNGPRLEFTVIQGGVSRARARQRRGRIAARAGVPRGRHL